MGDWIRKYVADKEDSLEYLQALLRLGIYAEFAANYLAANKYLALIGEHPKLNDPAASFKGRKISNVGFKRLQNVQNAIQFVITYRWRCS